MEYVVLGLLHLGVKTIYELNAAFKQGVSLFYSASYGSLQAAVKKLLEANYIVMTECVENGRQKKHYHITPSGREGFLEWMGQEYTLGNKLEVAILSRLFFLGLIETAEAREALIEKMIVAIEAACQELQKTDEEIQALPSEIQEHPVFHYHFMSLQYGRNAHGQALEWFKALLLDEKKRNKS